MNQENKLLKRTVVRVRDATAHLDDLEGDKYTEKLDRLFWKTSGQGSNLRRLRAAIDLGTIVGVERRRVKSDGGKWRGTPRIRA